MTRRRPSPVHSLAASPVLVGAITVLVVLVAVFLAYNANRGLPFVPSYQISAQVPTTDALVRGNDVRVAGVRVGVVDQILPVANTDGACGVPADELSFCAKLDLKLDQTVNPLPADSTYVIRNRSALGLKYLEFRVGESSETLPEGAILGVDSARPEPVDLDQVLNMFQEPTRDAIQENTAEFGNALAGRGAAINAAIAELVPLLERLVPAMRNLASPRTDLAGFFRSLARAAAEVAPVAEQQAGMFAGLNRTFAALADVARPYIQDSITEGVETQAVAQETLPRIRPFLINSAGLFEDLLPASRALAAASPALDAAFTSGVPALRAIPRLNDQLAPTALSLVAFGEDPGVVSGLNALRRTATTLDPLLRFITPAQTVCNYAGILLDNAQDMSSEGDGIGTWLRTITVVPPVGPNSESGPSSGPASGPELNNHLHFNPYPNTAAPGQPLECEAGNETYQAGRTVIGNAPGNSGTSTRGQD